MAVEMVDVWGFRYRNLTILSLIMFISFLSYFNVCLQCRPASKIFKLRVSMRFNTLYIFLL